MSARIGSPVSGCGPTSRGSASRRRARSRSTVAGDRGHRECRIADPPCGVLRRPRRRQTGVADRGPVEPGERDLEPGIPGRRLAFHRPVFPGNEGLDAGLALADQPERHRLHPARRAAARQLAPQHRGEPVAHQVVERPARLPRPHQVHVDPARLRQCRAYRRRRHLAERDPAHRPAAYGVPFLQPAQHLPGDRLALAVRVGRQHQGLGLLQRLRHRAQRPGGALAGLVDHGEVLVGLHRARLRRQVADMAPGRDHPVAPAQPGPDGPRLGRRLDDDDIHDAPSAARAAPGAPGDRGAGIGQFFERRETARPAPAGRRTRDGRVAARPAPVRDGHDRPAPRLPARAPRGSRAPRASANPLRGREPD